MVNWHLILGIISGALAVAAVIPYVKDILHGSTRPNIVSWGLWVLLLLISIFAQISAGASWSLVFLIGDLVGTSLILVLCLVGYGYQEYGWLEGVCLLLAVIAIVSWQLTRQPLLAIIFAIIADLMASIPTVVKAYRDPRSEHPASWFVVVLAAALGLLSTTIVNPANLIFPAYVLLINGLIGSLALMGRLNQKRSGEKEG